jgi:hypothetical protein
MTSAHHVPATCSLVLKCGARIVSSQPSMVHRVSCRQHLIHRRSNNSNSNKAAESVVNKPCCSSLNTHLLLSLQHAIMTSDAFVVTDSTVQELAKADSKKSGSISTGVGFFNHMVSRLQGTQCAMRNTAATRNLFSLCSVLSDRPVAVARADLRGLVGGNTGRSRQ